MIKHL